MPRAKLLSTIRPDPFKPPAGRKQIWLPNFTLTFIRTRHLPPNMAQFLVPLNLNKLDLKDYLWHAYNIPVLSVRSFVQQLPVQQGRPGSKTIKPRRWHRPRALKRMTVELAEMHSGGPFVWPEEEKDLEAWDKETWKTAKETQESMNDRMTKGATAPAQGIQTLARQAEALLQGKTQWRPTWANIIGKEQKAGSSLRA